MEQKVLDNLGVIHHFFGRALEMNTLVGVISMHSFSFFVSFLGSPEVFRSAYRHCFILHYEALNVWALIWESLH